MKKLFITFVIAGIVTLLPLCEAMGQKATDAHLYGHVTDRSSGEHLPYVTVLIEGTTIGCTTDSSGHYFLENLPTGEFILKVQMIGYESAEQPVTIERNSSQEVNF